MDGMNKFTLRENVRCHNVYRVNRTTRTKTRTKLAPVKDGKELWRVAN
jgi:hypothetical protein